MPKLKKHSQIQQRLSPDSPQRKSDTQADNQTENVDSNQPIFKPTRMKLAQRTQFFTKSARKEQKTQPKEAKQGELQPAEMLKDEVIDNFLNKYTDNDEDDLEIDGKKMQIEKKKQAKAKQNGIRISNKMFSNLTYHQQDEQSYKKEDSVCFELQVEKKHRKVDDNFMQKIQKKATTFKNKLEYKQLTKDSRYKSYMQEQLVTLEQTDEINLVVQVPKIFAGKKAQVQAAIFLKNSKEEKPQVTQNTVDISQTQEQQNSLPKDRKTYYEELGKHVRLKKAEMMTQNSLKDCFRKSMLDDKDYIPDLENTMNNSIGSAQESQLSRPLQSKISREKITASLDMQIQNRHVHKVVSKEDLVQWKTSKPQRKPEAMLKTQVINVDTQEKEIITIDDNSSPFCIPEPKNTKPKPIKSKAKTFKKKHAEFQFKDYIEIEADLSDDELQGGPKHRDNQDDSSDDTDVDSLIDNNEIKVTTKERKLLQNKYIQDVIDEEERRYNEMKKKMEARFFQGDQKLEKRMKEAAKRNIQKDKKEQQEKAKVCEQTKQESVSFQTSDNSAEKQRNSQKLALLQQMMGKQKKQQKQIKLNQTGGRVNKLQAIEQGLLQKQSIASRKVKRNGLKDIQAHKKPVTINYKKK